MDKLAPDASEFTREAQHRLLLGVDDDRNAPGEYVDVAALLDTKASA